MNGEETRDKSLQQAIHAEVRHVTGHIQARMNQEMHMHEVFIPNSKAEARCSVFLSDDWNSWIVGSATDPDPPVGVANASILRGTLSYVNDTLH
ncbi:unnamed protein product [Aphanomyces euteiches]